MTDTRSSAVLRAQANFRAAWETHRIRQDDGSRLALEKAKRELDEVQRVAAQVFEEVDDVVKR